MALDFKKLLNQTPEERKKHLKEIQERYEDAQAALKHKVNYLRGRIDKGEITNAWEITFIYSIYDKLNSVFPYLNDKQEQKLTELFNRY